MKATIETNDYKTGAILEVEIGETQWGDNVVFTRTAGSLTAEDPRPVSIAFPLDAEAARAISFALGELAKTLGRK